jgi:hypothetical protein
MKTAMIVRSNPRRFPCFFFAFGIGAPTDPGFVGGRAEARRAVSICASSNPHCSSAASSRVETGIGMGIGMGAGA